MLRLAFFPILLLIIALLSGVLLWLVYRKVKKGVDYSIQKGSQIANDQKRKWAEKEQRKHLPAMVRKGQDDYQIIEQQLYNLPNSWQQSLAPIVNMAKEILDDVVAEYDPQSKGNASRKKLNSVRAFFIHSLDALLQFIAKLNSDHAQMSASEVDQARQNITVLKADLLKHQETLHKVRRFDFEVLMDVIKARLKS